MQLGPLARALALTSGRAVAERAAPLASVVGVGAAVVFGGSGMHPRDLVVMLGASRPFRAGMWAAWIALATPAVASAFDAPGTVTLRSLRPPRALFALLIVLLAAAQLPWIALFAAGAGPLAALAAALEAVAATAALTAIRSSRGRALFALTATIVVAGVPPLVALAPGAALAWAATRCAWREALEARTAIRLVRRAPAAVALALAEIASTVRGSLARVEGAAMVVLAAGGALALTLRNDPDAHPFARALAVLAAPLAAACALLAAPALEVESRMRNVLRPARTTALTVAIAAALALAAPTSAFAATAGGVAVAAAHAPVGLPFATAAWALPIAAVTSAWSRRASRARRPSTFVLGVLVIAVVFTLVPASC